MIRPFRSTRPKPTRSNSLFRRGTTCRSAAFHGAWFSILIHLWGVVGCGQGQPLENRPSSATTYDPNPGDHDPTPNGDAQSGETTGGDAPADDPYEMPEVDNCYPLVMAGERPAVVGTFKSFLVPSWTFVVRESDHRVVIYDVGYEETDPEFALDRMRDCLALLFGNADPKDAAIVFSHWHADHIDGVSQFNGALSQVTYYGHTFDTEKTEPGQMKCPALFGTQFADIDYPTNTHFVELTEHNFVAEPLSTFGDWTVHWCPGHTAGFVCLANTERNIVLHGNWLHESFNAVVCTCGNDNEKTGYAGESQNCRDDHNNPVSCIAASRDFVGDFATQCNSHGMDTESVCTKTPP